MPWRSSGEGNALPQGGEEIQGEKRRRIAAFNRLNHTEA
jgi:hypothetical protein